ncbi:uncharacterized protein LOC119292212 [Triticum dicoccoides]|uniref:uncharacterized protein LOC119292212 n=1 Tax=Triticum dicoccoides TaxID=85692 RepID=UPI0018906DBB|nr:uncharacterized protein LOC119292212 [Triticum dicoccoides]XP_037426938.1 uncharacterized protein LOC119292212 [Triticum dicoccoides]
MAAVMDLDLNCAPPSPEPAPQDHRLAHAMLRQEHAYRHQVEDLHRLYWAQRNLRPDAPFWEQSHDVLYPIPTRSTAMATSSRSHIHTIDPDPSGGKQAIWCGNGVAGSLGAGEGSSARRKPDHGGGVQGRSSGYRRMIDLEKPAMSEDDDDDDDVEILSPARFSDYAKRSAGFVDNSQCYQRENAAAHVRFGSTGSSDTPDSHSPVKAKATASGRMLIDLNIAQEDDLNVCPDSSKNVFCSLLASSRTMQSGEGCSNSSKAFHIGGESSIGSSKGSSITVAASMPAPDSTRGVMARGGICDPQSSSKPFRVEASNHDVRLRGNIQHQHTLDNVSGMSSQASMEIPREEMSVRASGRHSSSSSDLRKIGGQTAVYRECQEESLAVICDDEMEGFDLNVSVGSIELPSMMDSSPREKHASSSDGVDKLLSHYFTEDKVQENISSLECPTVIDQQHMAESMDGKSVRSPDSGVATNRSMSIPETPQGRDYACPRLRPSSNGESNSMNAPITYQVVAEDELLASTAAQTLVSLFTDSAAWITDSHCSNNQADAQDGGDEPQVSLDSFEEGVMNLEALRDDGDSVTVTAPDKDGPSCGIKLRRGRGMRDFQREILPGLVSLARHEICDDLHAIGYEIRKTRQRRAPGDKYGPSTRSRLPRRCSNAWNY